MNSSVKLLSCGVVFSSFLFVVLQPKPDRVALLLDGAALVSLGIAIGMGSTRSGLPHDSEKT